MYISDPKELTFPFFTYSLQGSPFGFEETFKEGRGIEGGKRHYEREEAFREN